MRHTSPEAVQHLKHEPWAAGDSAGRGRDSLGRRMPWQSLCDASQGRARAQGIGPAFEGGPCSVAPPLGRAIRILIHITAMACRSCTMSAQGKAKRLVGRGTAADKHNRRRTGGGPSKEAPTKRKQPRPEANAEIGPSSGSNTLQLDALRAATSMGRCAPKPARRTRRNRRDVAEIGKTANGIGQENMENPAKRRRTLRANSKRSQLLPHALRGPPLHGSKAVSTEFC